MRTKSISLLLILALFVTIGGVYAAWSYAETPLTAVHGHIGSFGVANAVVNNAKGTITVDGTSAHLSLDQSSDTDYTAKLVGSGSILLIFSPSEVWANSNANLTEIKMNYALVTTNQAPLEFKIPVGDTQTALFSRFDTTTKTEITLTKVTDSGNANYGKFVAELPAATIVENLLAINSFKLETIEKHTAVSNAIGGFGNIGIELSEIETAAVAAD